MTTASADPARRSYPPAPDGAAVEAHSSLPKIDILVWATIAVVLLLLRVGPDLMPDRYNDSFQYFSVAENTMQGRFGQTSIVHFDAERSFGTIPAPSVTTAPGFPVVIGLVSLLGLSIEDAALLVSLVATVACVPLLFWIGAQVGLSRLFRNVVVGGFVLNGAVIQFGTSALTEATFTFVVLLGLALLVAARRHGQTGATWLWIAAGLAFGGAYSVRYAGLFLVIGLGVLVVRHLLTFDRSLARGHALAFAVASVIVLAGFARNISLVGDWRGGNTMSLSTCRT